MKSLRYDQVFLIPSYGVVNNRSEATTIQQLGKRLFTLPIVPSNMASVISEELCEWLAKRHYFYILHRFPKYMRLDHFSLNFCRRMEEMGLYTSISLGVKEDSIATIKLLKANGISPDYITLDIAHADSIVGISGVERIRDAFPYSYIIGGNVATASGVHNLVKAGANCVKVGIGGGSPCSTYPKTGFHVPMFSCVLDCASESEVPIIADGGVKEPGDIAKALVAGATMVMLGGYLAGHDESPGELIKKGGVTYKEYYGSASSRNKGENRHVEGHTLFLESKGSIVDTYKDLTESLQSSISYAGGRNLFAFDTVQWQTIG